MLSLGGPVTFKNAQDTARTGPAFAPRSVDVGDGRALPDAASTSRSAQRTGVCCVWCAINLADLYGYGPARSGAQMTTAVAHAVLRIGGKVALLATRMAATPVIERPAASPSVDDRSRTMSGGWPRSAGRYRRDLWRRSQPDLRRVEAKMKAVDASLFAPLANAFVDLIGSGGKRLRPAVALHGRRVQRRACTARPTRLSLRGHLAGGFGGDAAHGDAGA